MPKLGWYSRLEGGDGVGKTTQIQLAKEFDQKHGIGAEFIREPGGTRFGLDIRRLLLHSFEYTFTPDEELLLFTVDRLHLWNEKIEPALTEDRPVISDRGVESTECYQSAAGEADIARVREITRLVMPERYIHPDALVVLSLSEEVRHKRLTAGRSALDKIEQREAEYMEKVAAAYAELATQPHVTAINGEGDPEEIFEKYTKHALFGRFAA